MEKTSRTVLHCLMSKPKQISKIDMIGIGQRLRAIRETEGLSSKDFALSVHIDPSSYSKIENGTKALKMEMGYIVAERYGVSMDFIYRGRLTDLPEKISAHLRQVRNSTDR